MSVVVNTETCVGCGQCSKVCFPGKISLNPEIKKAVVDPDVLCMKCGRCSAVCPTQSVSLDGVIPEKVATAFPDPEAFDTVVLTRRSVREYTKDPVDRAEIEKIIEIALKSAPTACNTQRQRVTVISGREKIDPIVKAVGHTFELSGDKRFAKSAAAIAAGLDPITYNAPHIIVCWSRPAVLPFGDDSEQYRCLDMGIFTETVDLLAHAHGLGCCYIGFIVSTIADTPEGKKLLGVPEDAKVASILTLGHPVRKFPNVSGRIAPEITWVE